MNVFEALDSIEEALESARTLPWPLQERSVVDRKKLRKLVARTRDVLPEEVHQARWLSRETKRIAAESRGKAKKVVAAAEVRAEAIIEDKIHSEEVVVRAKTEAEKIIEAARTQADRLLGEADAQAAAIRSQAKAKAIETQREADQYARRVLLGMERELGKVLGAVQKSQECFQGDGGPDSTEMF